MEEGYDYVGEVFSDLNCVSYRINILTARNVTLKDYTNFFYKQDASKHN